LARLLADLLGIAFAVASATVAARFLGLAGKGYYSSLLLLAGVFIQLSGAGLGEAAIVLAGRGQASLAVAVSATVFAVVPLSVTGGLAFWATSTALLRTTDPRAGLAVILASVVVALNTFYSTIVWFLVAREKVVRVAVLSIVSTGSAAAALWFLLAVRGQGVAGGILAGVIGAVVGLGGALTLLRGASVSLRPSLARDYLRAAFRLGLALQVSNLLVLFAARLDLILVYRLRGPSIAGAYSVALTIGALVGCAPMAASYAAFPRLASVDEEQSRVLTLQVFRLGMAIAILTGAALALVSPYVIPLAFGEQYRSAVGPTLILIPGGVFWSGQWLLCRAAAARGAPRQLLVSFAASLVTMIGLDLVLIGPFGGAGAAVAATTSAMTGFVVAFGYRHRAGWDLGGFVPRLADLRSLLTTLRRSATVVIGEQSS
jgi:O-antigen/teichoic acid export membrane protein